MVDGTESGSIVMDYGSETRPLEMGHDIAVAREFAGMIEEGLLLQPEYSSENTEEMRRRASLSGRDAELAQCSASLLSGDRHQR